MQQASDPASTTSSRHRVDGERLEVVGYDDPRAKALIDALDAEMRERYGDSDATVVAPEQFAPPQGTFVLLIAGERPVACAGLRAYDVSARRPGYLLGDEVEAPEDGRDAELKRMFVAAGERRRGFAGRVLAAIETHALRAGFARIVLESGTAQPDACAFYERHGYRRVEGFGVYADDPDSICYGKDLQ